MSVVFLLRLCLHVAFYIKFQKYNVPFTYNLRISVFCRTTATIVSELDIFPVLYHQNGSVVDVMGNIFCSNTSGSPSVLSPVLAKASHVCWRLNINCIQGFFRPSTFANKFASSWIHPDTASFVYWDTSNWDIRVRLVLNSPADNKDE